MPLNIVSGNLPPLEAVPIAGMVRVIRRHRRNMKINIINDSEVSRLSVAMH